MDATHRNDNGYYRDSSKAQYDQYKPNNIRFLPMIDHFSSRS